MAVSLDRINQQRHIAGIFIRALGLLLLTCSVVNFGLALRWWFANASRWYDAVGFALHCVDSDWALSFLITGVLLIALARRLARMIVPIPRDECPRCGYLLQQLTTTRCPECGLSLTRDAQPAPPQS